MNVYRLLQATPMPRSVRLRFRRAIMDFGYELDSRRRVKNGGRAEDAWEEGNWDYEYQILEDDEAKLHSEQLLNRARELRIPIPTVFEGDRVSSDYRRSSVDARYLLSIVGEQKVRAAIREEEKYRSERWARRIPYITALSGLVGTITGLVALLIKTGN